MRVVLVCGDRHWDDLDKVRRIISKDHKRSPITYLVEGGQSYTRGFVAYDTSKNWTYGADYQAAEVAKQLGIQVVECPALWSYYGRKAGPIRNQKQLDVAMRIARVDEDDEDAESTHNISVIAFHSDLKNSKGTKDMVNRAKKAGVKVRIIT